MKKGPYTVNASWSFSFPNSVGYRRLAPSGWLGYNVVADVEGSGKRTMERRPDDSSDSHRKH
jgi:hypothetical protein